MPMPVSATSNRSSKSSGSRAATLTVAATSPWAVNLMALPTRLDNACAMRAGSPRTTAGTSAAMWCVRRRFFSRTGAANNCVTLATRERRSKATDSISILPASILEKSRMSLMIFSRPSPEVLMVCTYSRCSVSRRVPTSRLVMPSTPFIGVRISWLMLARNSLFARAAASAASLARRSSSCARSSQVVSCVTAMSPTRRQRNSSPSPIHSMSIR